MYLLDADRQQTPRLTDSAANSGERRLKPAVEAYIFKRIQRERRSLVEARSPRRRRCVIEQRSRTMHSERHNRICRSRSAKRGSAFAVGPDDEAQHLLRRWSLSAQSYQLQHITKSGSPARRRKDGRRVRKKDERVHDGRQPLAPAQATVT